ncbi:hypothetical protein TWF718_010757 [Orbilia javanica]|uniref:F-box domain-containing protein n=1 Tax=Orbilia javanica TaxID=47235 RepID=A0AAN8MGA8_9PEZI
MESQNTTGATHHARSIISFPNELLLNIFKDPGLSNTDLTNAQLACSLFRDNIKPYVTRHRKYTFKVDADGYPVWKLIRLLLNNPELDFGKQITEITLKWPKELTSRWKVPDCWEWTDYEKARIKEICQQWKITSLTEIYILHGCFSESLLIILMCFTPNLRSLDMGDVGKYFEPGCPDHQLFLLDNIRQEDTAKETVGVERFPPGLTNLQSFRVSALSVSSQGHMFDLEDLLPIFFLPRIERIEAVRAGCSRYRPGHHPPREGPSTLRSFILDSCPSNTPSEECLAQIAAITGNLEYVKILRKGRKTFQNKEKSERIGLAFLKHNKNTLAPTEVIIDEGGFNEAGEYGEYTARLRRVAVKQKLFEEAQSRMKRLQIKPSPILALGPDILSHLLRFLGPVDVFNLLLTCRSLKDICYRNIWSEFAITSRRWPPFGRAGIEKLQRMIDEGGPIGFEHLESLEIDGYYLDPRYNRTEKPLLEAFVHKIDNGDTPKLRQMKLIVPFLKSSFSPSQQDLSPIGGCNNILTATKKHSQKKLPSEFDLQLTTDMSICNKVFELCDLIKLTTLRLCFSSWSPEDVAKDINALATLLNALPSPLRRFTIGEGSDQRFLRHEHCSIGSCEVLQEAITSLKSLKKLSIYNGYALHPSYLFVPPEGVTSLSYRGGVSAIWWQKFAEYPFRGVESLKLKFLHHGPKLKLGKVKVSGLVRLTIHENGHRFPSDLFKLLLGSNPLLSERCLKSLAAGRAWWFVRPLSSEEDEAIEYCKDELCKRIRAKRLAFAEEFATESIVKNRVMSDDFEEQIRYICARRVLGEFEHELSATECNQRLRIKLERDIESHGRERPADSDIYTKDRRDDECEGTYEEKEIGNDEISGGSWRSSDRGFFIFN